MSSNPKQQITLTRNDLSSMLRGINAARIEIADRAGESMRLQDLVSRLRVKLANLRTTVKQLNRAHVILKRDYQILQTHYQNQIVSYGALYGEHQKLKERYIEASKLLEGFLNEAPMPPTFVPEPTPMFAAMNEDQAYYEARETAQRSEPNGQA